MEIHLSKAPCGLTPKGFFFVIRCECRWRPWDFHVATMLFPSGTVLTLFKCACVFAPQNLSQSVAHDWTSGLQRLILNKEEEIRAAGWCRVQLQLPGKPDR